jgi:hypothetical protein
MTGPEITKPFVWPKAKPPLVVCTQARSLIALPALVRVTPFAAITCREFEVMSLPTVWVIEPLFERSVTSKPLAVMSPPTTRAESFLRRTWPPAVTVPKLVTALALLSQIRPPAARLTTLAVTTPPVCWT